MKFILAFFALASGMLALFVDPKENKVARNGLLVVLALVFVATLLQNKIDDADADRAKMNVQVLLNQTDGLVGSLRALSSAMNHRFDELPAQLATWGFTPKAIASAGVPIVKQSVAANAIYEREQQSWIDAGRKPSQTAVWYFPKDVDGAKVTEALRGLGLTVTAGQAKLPKNSTNSLWAGTVVPLDEVKRVSAALMRAGVQFQQICYFPKWSPHRTQRLIEVGASAAADSDPVVSPQQLDALTTLPEPLHQTEPRVN